MKQNRSRLIALLLAMCLLVGALPTLALADDAILTMDDYQNARNRVEEALAAPDVPVEQTNQHYVARSSEVESIVKSTVTGDLSVDSATAFALPVAGRLVLRAPEAEAYRWQIRVGDQWANIVGDTESEMVLTYAKLQNALSGNAAVVRCALTRAGETVYIAEATVTVNPNVETETTTVTEQIPVTSYYQPSAVSRAKELNEGVMAANDQSDTCSIIITYKFADDEQAANPWTATVAKGSSLSRTVVSPTVIGYTPDQEKVVLNVEDIQADITIPVIYNAALVQYRVNHLWQNIENDKYVLHETETKEDYTKSIVSDKLAKDYEGFTALLYETDEVAADGSTEVEIKYDRKYYLMTFDLDGGYGVEPIYARFGAPIIVDTPTKPGYTFAGWDKEIAKTMPAENTSYKASWTIGDQAKVTVVVWGENANDEGYSFYKNAEIMATPGEMLTLNDLQGKLICGKEEHTHSNECYSCGHKGDHVRTLECYGINSEPVNPNNEGYGDKDARTHFEDQCDHKDWGDYTCKGLKQYLKDGSVCQYKNGKKDGWTTNYEYFYFLYFGGQYYEITQGQYNSWKTNTGKSVEHGRDTYYVYEGKANICQHTHTDSCYSCGKEEHTHTSACYYNTSFMEEPELWKPVRSDEVTVAADGTTILNVYYDRVEFTLHFRDAYSSNDDYGTIKAKWGANIREAFNQKCKSAGTSNWSESSNAGSPWTSYLDIMPTEDRTYYANKEGYGTSTAYYYVEGLDGKDKLFYENKSTGSGYTVTVEEFIEISGFTFNPKRSSKVGDDFDGAKFYYTRNSYNLKFYNHNGEIEGSSKTVKYEAPLSGYDFTPDYPAGLEPNAYVFDGWYTTDGCYEGSKADLTTMTMPAADVILYAKWAPKTHTVTTWLTNELKDAVNVGDTGSNVQKIPHGSFATKPADPKNGSYTFVGWFYTENDEEKAFDFSMPVNRDLKLYAKWSSNTLMEYTIKYAVENEDGSLTYIAKDTTGSALAGSTKTFDAKTGTQLNEGYQSGYFPKVSSHSITIDIADASKNKYTFVYVAKDEVEYTVRYLDKATGEPVVVDGVPTPDKMAKTRDAVVTETFKQITGYAPDAYQKQLVLAAEGNEIIFWYTKDNTHAPVQTIHWIQNIAGDGYTEYQSSTNLNGVIGTEYPETPLTIAGFTYNGTKSNANGTLTAAGLVLNLYYDRIEYPYEFRFVEKDSDPEKQLVDSVTGSARYQAQVTQTAKTIPGYTLTSADNQAINIAIEEGTTAVKNVKIFYYTEQTVDIKYEVVGPTGCGTLDNYQESQLKVTTGEVKGSKPAAADGFKFVGWYKDEGCTQPVDADWVKDSKLTPDKTKNYGTAEKPVMGYEAATYYAKFEYDTFDLTIKKEGLNKNTYGKSEDVESAIFTVSGGNQIWTVVCDADNNYSVTLTGLKCGTEYTVTEQNGWTWRYNGTNSEKFTHSGGPEKVLTFKNTLSNPYWLGGDNFKTNVFGSSTGN